MMAVSWGGKGAIPLPEPRDGGAVGFQAFPALERRDGASVLRHTTASRTGSGWAPVVRHGCVSAAKGKYSCQKGSLKTVFSFSEVQARFGLGKQRKPQFYELK